MNNVRDWVHEGDVDLNRLSDEILDFSQHRKVVLGLDILGVGCIEAGDETTEGRDPDTLADTENGCGRGKYMAKNGLKRKTHKYQYV